MSNPETALFWPLVIIATSVWVSIACIIWACWRSER